MHNDECNDSGITGKVIANRYRVLQLIGAGAMGSVYLAQDLQLHRQVALKVLRRKWLERTEVRKRLEHECRIMARLGPHPHIVTLFDRLEYEGNAVLVMEYIKGDPLDKLLDARRTELATDAGKRETRIFGEIQSQAALDEMTVLELVGQCLSALAFAHSKQVVHRDIKPSNIIVAVDHGGRVEAKLMDFGIGKLVDDGDEYREAEAQLTALTQADGPGPGTPAYMAPEQIDAVRFGAVGPQTDLYSIGVMLFELLTCRLPFSGTYTELLHGHTNVEPPDPSAYCDTLSPMMVQVLMRSLQKIPSQRYPSAEAFRADIKALASDSMPSVSMMSPSFTQVQRTSPQGSKKHRLALAGLVVLGILLFGGSAFFLLAGSSGPEGEEALEASSIPESGTEPAPDAGIEAADGVQASQPRVDEEGSPEIEQARLEARSAKSRADEEFARVRESPLIDEDYRQGETSMANAEASLARGDAAAAFDDYEIATRRYVAAAQGAQDRLRSVESQAREALRDAEEAERAAIRAFDEEEKNVTDNANYGEGNSLLTAGRSALNSGDYHNASQSLLSAKRYFEQARPAPVVEASQPSPEPAPPRSSPVASQRAPDQVAQDDQARRAAEEQRRRASEQASHVLAEAQASRDHARARFDAQDSTPRANKPFLEAEKALQDASAAAERGDFSSAQESARKAKRLYDEANPPQDLIRDSGGSIIR